MTSQPISVWLNEHLEMFIFGSLRLKKPFMLDLVLSSIWCLTNDGPLYLNTAESNWWTEQAQSVNTDITSKLWCSWHLTWKQLLKSQHTFEASKINKTTLNPTITPFESGWYVKHWFLLTFSLYLQLSFFRYILVFSFLCIFSLPTLNIKLRMNCDRNILSMSSVYGYI